MILGLDTWHLPAGPNLYNGHAIEATAGYGRVMHGEAVAMGMVQVS